jgi:glycosyltransferase involved in cell wall biosynthesis
MRILYSHRIHVHDGQSLHVEELITGLLQEGHDVHVVGPGFYHEAGFGGRSSKVALLRRLLPGALGELAEIIYNVPAYLRLRRACRTFQPELIYERYSLYFLAGRRLARRRRIPYFLEVNAPVAIERAHYTGMRLRPLARRLERLVWHSADRVIVITNVLAAMIAAAGIPPERIGVIPNAAVAQRFLPRPWRPEQMLPRPLVIGFAGFVRAAHGLDAVIRGMADHPEYRALRLLVIGDGPGRGALEQLAASLGIAGRVRFTGLVEPERLPDLINDLDIALLPRVVPYASPLTMFDYMAASRAIVAPDQPNIREILTHEQTALLFDPAREDTLWEAVARLVADPALRVSLGLAARAELDRSNLTWRGNAGRVAAMYRELVANGFGGDHRKQVSRALPGPARGQAPGP